jgi:hypothetical protein
MQSRVSPRGAARAAARKAPNALECKTIALDGNHVQRARAVGLDGARLAQVRRAEPRGSRAVGGRKASRELRGDAACEVHARQEGEGEGEVRLRARVQARLAGVGWRRLAGWGCTPARKTPPCAWKRSARLAASAPSASRKASIAAMQYGSAPISPGVPCAATTALGSIAARTSASTAAAAAAPESAVAAPESAVAAAPARR